MRLTAKHTKSLSDPSGSKYFYEVSIYAVSKKRSHILISKYYKSDKPLTLKKDKILKKLNGIIYIKSINLL